MLQITRNRYWKYLDYSLHFPAERDPYFPSLKSSASPLFSIQASSAKDRRCIMLVPVPKDVGCKNM